MSVHALFHYFLGRSFLVSVLFVKTLNLFFFFFFHIFINIFITSFVSFFVEVFSFFFFFFLGGGGGDILLQYCERKYSLYCLSMIIASFLTYTYSYVCMY